MSRSRFVPAWPPGASVARARRVVLVAVIALPLALLQAGCDSGPGEPPEPENQAPTARLSASSLNVEAGASVSFDGSTSSDSDGTIADYNWELQAPDESEVSLEASGDHAELVADVAGTYDVDLTVTDDDGATDGAGVSVRVDMPDPESITLTLEIQAADGDSLVTTDVTFGGETVATDFAAGTLPLPFLEESGPLCALATVFFEESCLTLKPNHDQSVQLTGQRKVVELEVSVEPEEAEVTVTDRDGRVDERTGSFTRDYRKIRGERVVAVSAEDYESESQTVSSTESHTLSFTLEPEEVAPQCSDGIDNDGDGLVDADDFGCLSPDGVYEPEDDDEEHRVFSRTIFGYGQSNIVSETNPRETMVSVGSLPNSIQVAIGEIQVATENYIEADDENEGFAFEFQTGSSANQLDHRDTTAVVNDEAGVTGWRDSALSGITRHSFPDGTFYAIDALHRSVVDGESGGDVLLTTPFEGDDPHGYVYIAYVFDPDDVPSGNTSSATTQSRAGPLESGACQKTAFGEVCRDVVPDWYLPRR